MIQQSDFCNDDRLREMLGADNDSQCDNSLLEHVENCQHCQHRLDELAADGLDWTRAVERLSSNIYPATSAPDNQFTSSTNLRAVAWTESMAKDLLSAPAHPEMLGRLGRYDVERLIGSGGMGVVFRAHDTELNRPVAIKLLAPYLASSGTATNRFAREARAAAGIVDDHVVPIFNVETETEPPFLVMQYIAGGSLQEKLDRHGPLEVAEVIRVGLQVAKGLAAAHAQGLIHRDVKPSNILLDEGVERALLTDFGLARTESDASLTRSGFHPGTPHYMSPEQVRGEAIDSRSDLFGLGCVLYAACVGHPPFRAESSYAVLRRITDDEPRPIREINSNVPEWLEATIAKLLRKHRDDRFDSANEVAELLEGCLAHVNEPTTKPLPTAVTELASAGQQNTKTATKRHSGFRFPPIRKLIVAAAFALPLLLAGIFITIETSKGTITIESEADDVPIVIRKDGEVHDKLRVSRDGKSIRLRAGQYEILFDGDMNEFAIDNGSIELRRGKEVVARIREHAGTQESAVIQQDASTVDSTPVTEPKQAKKERRPELHSVQSVLRLDQDVHVRLIGDLARRYERMLGGLPKDASTSPNTVVEVSAKVTERLSDNEYRIQHFSGQSINGKPDHLVSVEAIVKRADFETVTEQTGSVQITLSGDENYAIRAAYKRVESATSAHFQLDDVTRLTLLEQSQVINGAESIWREALAQWNAEEKEFAGDRIQLKVVVNDNSPTGSSRWSEGLSNPEISAEGSIDDLLQDILPRQITHIVLARLAGRSLPRWLEMGTGALAQSEETQRLYWSLLHDAIEAGQLLPLGELLAIEEYHSDAEKQKLAYAQSMAFCDYMIQTQPQGRQFVLKFAKQEIESNLTDPKMFEQIDSHFQQWLIARIAKSNEQQAETDPNRSVSIKGAVVLIPTDDRGIAFAPGKKESEQLNKTDTEHGDGRASKDTRPRRLSLGQAIKEFNYLHSKDSRGNVQPPLSHEEVYSAVNWRMGNDELPDEVIRPLLTDFTFWEPMLSGWRFVGGQVDEGNVQTWQIKLETNGLSKPIVIRKSAIVPLHLSPEVETRFKEGTTQSLKPLIDQFNANHDEIYRSGKLPHDLAPLSLDEVLAAMTSPMHAVMEATVSERLAHRLAQFEETGHLPPDTRIELVPVIGNHIDQKFYVERIQMVLPNENDPEKVDTLLVRNRFVSQALNEPTATHWSSPTADGIQAGVRFSPARQSYQRGQVIDVDFLYRSVFSREVSATLPQTFQFGKVRGIRLDRVSFVQPRWPTGSQTTVIGHEPVVVKGHRMQICFDENEELKPGVNLRAVTRPDAKHYVRFIVPIPAGASTEEQLEINSRTYFSIQPLTPRKPLPLFESHYYQHWGASVPGKRLPNESTPDPEYIDPFQIGASLAIADVKQVPAFYNSGLQVTKVAPHSPAAKAGIEVGDILLSWEGIQFYGDDPAKPFADYRTQNNQLHEKLETLSKSRGFASFLMKFDLLDHRTGEVIRIAPWFGGMANGGPYKTKIIERMRQLREHRKGQDDDAKPQASQVSPVKKRARQQGDRARYILDVF